MKPKTVGRVDGGKPPSRPHFSECPEAGLLPGTILLTRDGEMPVEFINEGDAVITRDQGFVAVQRILRTRQMGRAITFTAGSLGDTRPECDLILPAGQKLLIRDWRAQALFGQKEALVRADALVDGEFIRDMGVRPMYLYQLHLSGNHILYAGGLEIVAQSTPIELRPAA